MVEGEKKEPFGRGYLLLSPLWREGTATSPVTPGWRRSARKSHPYYAQMIPPQKCLWNIVVTLAQKRAADVVGPGTSVALIELITVYWPHSRHKKLVSLVSNKSSWQALSFKILLFFLSPLYEKLWVFLTNWHFGRLLSINGVRHHQTHVSGFSRPRLAPHYLRCIS